MNTASSSWQVPWRIRDCFKVLGLSFLFEVGLVVFLALAASFYAGMAGLGRPDPHWISSLFTESPSSEYVYLIEGTFTLWLFWVLVLKPHGVSVFSFFRKSAGAESPAGTDDAPQWESAVRYGSRLFFISVLLVSVVLAAVILFLWVMSRSVIHQDPATVISGYLSARREESEIILQPQMSYFRALVIAFIAPPLEELVFRGGLYAALRMRLGEWQANLASSLTFACMHMYVLNLPQVLLIGMLAAYAYERTRTLHAPIILHAFWNFFGALMVQPALWLLVPVGLLAWLRLKKRAQPSEGSRKGWKIYAVLLPVLMAIGYASEPEIVWQSVFEIPLLAGLIFYAWEKKAGTKRFWLFYAFFYPVWVGLILWASSIPEPSRLAWQQALGAGEPIRNINDLVIEIAGYVFVIGPAVIALWRLAFSPDKPQATA